MLFSTEAHINVDVKDVAAHKDTSRCKHWGG